MLNPCAAFLALLLAVSAPALAEEKVDAAKLEAGLTYQQGKIAVVDGAVTLNLPPTYRFLDADQAKMVLTDIWGNQRDMNVLGLIVPADKPVSGDGSWGVVLKYDKHGHVDDSNAATLNADQLLSEKKQVDKKDNEKRARQGFQSISVVGWTEPPRYDKPTHTLTWGQETAFGGDQGTVLNHNMRVLGRDGVLVLQAVASMGQREQVRAAMRDMAGFTYFNVGHRYDEFKGTVDSIAYYDLAAMVRGHAPRLSKMDRLWASLRNFNLLSILIVIGAVVFGVVRLRSEFAKIRARQQTP